MQPETQDRAIGYLAESLSIRLGEGTAPTVLINSAVIASLQSGGTMSEIASAFLLPSHQVWMANKCYDERKWNECIRFARQAIEGTDRLSQEGLVAACRFLCLASARIDDQGTFSEGIEILERMAADNWATSNVAFLRGFNLRLKGHLPKAEESFRRAYALSPGNFSAGREIAAACLERGNLEEAERYAREAHQIARRNPYLVDILVAVMIRKVAKGRGKQNERELDEMFRLLEEVGEQEGHSFYTTRRAEYEYVRGRSAEALQLVEQAIGKTPTLFEPRRLQAEILMKLGNKVKAREVIEDMRRIVDSRNPNDRRRNYRQYLETYAHYLTEVGQFDEAKNIFADLRYFTEAEKVRGVRDIEIVQGHLQGRGS